MSKRGGTLRPLAWLAAGCMAALAGCGDGPICPSEIVVFITSPSNGAAIVQSGADGGTQTDVVVRTNLEAGETVSLTVTGATSPYQATVDSDGTAIFTGVALPSGAVTLSASGEDEDCGGSTDEITVNVIAGLTCSVAIRETTVDSEYYELPVLNIASDPDAATAGFQANVDVTAAAGSAVELLVLDVETGVETAAGTATADANGATSVAATLNQGRQVVRAVCSGANGMRVSSGSTAVLVDTEAPVCSLASPLEGTTIIPQNDIDPIQAGTQINVVGLVTPNLLPEPPPIDPENPDQPPPVPKSDVLGVPTSFTLGADQLVGSRINVGGNGSAKATFTDAGNYDLTFTAQDYAGNTCSATRTIPYVTDGCSILYLEPQGTITSDSNNNPADGVQANLVVQIDPQCASQPVVADCGAGPATAQVAANGRTTIETTLCGDASCTATVQCTISVTNAVEIVTAVSQNLNVDTEGPGVTLTLATPNVQCGGGPVAGEIVDEDRNPANGVQIDVSLAAPTATTTGVEVTNGGIPTEPAPAPLNGNFRITLEPGQNQIIGFAQDELGNRSNTPACVVTLGDIVMDFAPGLVDGFVSLAEGTVSSSAITLDICGTVSEANATVTVRIDDGEPQAATVTGTSWCLNGVTLSEATHIIRADATSAGRSGGARLRLIADLTRPDQVSGLAIDTPDRQAAALSWIAPADSGNGVSSYIIKVADAPLDESNFDSAGTVVSGPGPRAPGEAQTLIVEQLRPGTQYYLAVASVDAAGNRSIISSQGPLSSDFARSGSVGPVSPGDNDNGLGYQFAPGDFNGDGFGDLAVAAPFKRVDAQIGAGTVYVYFGSPLGLGAPPTPDVIIEGTETSAQFGNGITAIQWGGDAADDLVVGAPFADNYGGRVYVFLGGAEFGTVTNQADADADVVIGSGGGWFQSSGLGWAVTRARFDDDDRDDLIITAPIGGGAVGGGVVVLYGGATGTEILLSDVSNSGSGDAKALVIQNPDNSTPAALFGQFVFNLGRTEGANDATDDLGVAYSEKNSALVLRGRAQPGAPGVALASFDTTKDLDIRSGSPDTTGRFGTAMTSISDLDGDGARDIVIAGWREGANLGRVLIVDGNAVGTQDVLAIDIALLGAGDTGILGVGSAVLNNAAATSADIDNDGLEDLALVAGIGADQVKIFIWYGGSIPTGTFSLASANHTISAPTGFSASAFAESDVTPMMAAWAGDVNGDGLEDITWADFVGNDRDGLFEVLFD